MINEATVNFKNTTYFVGRNGYVNMNGICIYNSYDSTIQLVPLNSWNKPSSAKLNIPKEDLVNFIEALKQFVK